MGRVEIQEGLAGRQKGFHGQRPARMVVRSSCPLTQGPQLWLPALWLL